MTPPNSEELLALPIWSRSIREEIVGILWAILAAVAHNRIVVFVAVAMALISLAAAIVFAWTALRAKAANQ